MRSTSITSAKCDVSSGGRNVPLLDAPSDASETKEAHMPRDMTPEERIHEGLVRLDVAYDQALTGSLQFSPHTAAEDEEQKVISEVLDGLRWILTRHDFGSPLSPFEGKWVPRHQDTSPYHMPFSMRHMVTDARGAALAWAKHVLFTTPYTQGTGCRIEFDNTPDG